MDFYSKPSPSEVLAHYGIIGMKWGVRRFQNKDGSLTPAGRKRVSQQYKKESEKAMDDLAKSYGRMQMEAYNKAADSMNRGGIQRFNESQRKKYGEKYAEREGYEQDYQKLFNDEFAKHLNQSLNDFYKSNEHYQRGKSLVDQYKMTSWDKLAKDNEEKIEELRRIVEEDDD